MLYFSDRGKLSLPTFLYYNLWSVMWKETRNQKRDKSAPAKAATDKTPKVGFLAFSFFLPVKYGIAKTALAY